MDRGSPIYWLVVVFVVIIILALVIKVLFPLLGIEVG